MQANLLAVLGGSDELLELGHVDLRGRGDGGRCRRGRGALLVGVLVLRLLLRLLVGVLLLLVVANRTSGTGDHGGGGGGPHERAAAATHHHRRVPPGSLWSLWVRDQAAPAPTWA